MEKIRLKTGYLDQRCNRWQPGEYYRDQLPEEIKTDPLYVAPIIKTEANNDFGITIPNKTRKLIKEEMTLNLDDMKRNAINNKYISANNSSLEDLMSIKGIGKNIAQSIILSRPYKNFGELKQKVRHAWDSVDINNLVF